MERPGCGQVVSVLKKGKKKQVKDELDRQKQAEKKKRRLEKALANSAAIRLELEKKRQMKIEEQQRLDQEGAAVAEAVALYALLGEEGGDKSHEFILEKGHKFGQWNCSSHGESCLENYWSSGRYSVGVEQVLDRYGYEQMPTDFYLRSLERAPYLNEMYQSEEDSADLIAALAISSLQIADDRH